MYYIFVPYLCYIYMYIMFDHISSLGLHTSFFLLYIFSFNKYRSAIALDIQDGETKGCIEGS